MLCSLQIRAPDISWTAHTAHGSSLCSQGCSGLWVFSSLIVQNKKYHRFIALLLPKHRHFNSFQKGQELQRVMEAVRSFNTALLSLQTRQESSRTVRTSWSIFRCFLFFDICYLLSGITLIIMAFTQEETEGTNYDNREVMIMSGAGFGIFATISALCNR